MATFESYPQGQFCWIDLMSKDMGTSRTFYSSLFGWEVAPQDTQGGPPYEIFTLEGQQLCGLGEMTPEMRDSGMPAVWKSYVSVGDLDATLVRAQELGATVKMPAMQVVDAGRMAIIQDPTGAFLSFWQPLQHQGAQLANVPNTWCWNELMTRDPAAAESFFSELFGWEFSKEENSPGNYWIIHNGERMNGGMLEMDAQMGDMPPCWSVYFTVADMEAAMDGVRNAGGVICHGPFDSSVGPIAIATDAEGGAFNLIALTVPQDE